MPNSWLVVDDNKLTNTIYTKLIHHILPEVSVETVSSVDAAEDSISNGPFFNLILTDIMMPDGGAEELFKRLDGKADVLQRIIPMTAGISEAGYNMLQLNGCRLFVEKPLNELILTQLFYFSTQDDFANNGSSKPPEILTTSGRSRPYPRFALDNVVFRDELRRMVEQIRRMTYPDDKSSVTQLLHKLSGTLNVYGYSGMAQAAQALHRNMLSDELVTEEIIRQLNELADGLSAL